MRGRGTCALPSRARSLGGAAALDGHGLEAQANADLIRSHLVLDALFAALGAVDGRAVLAGERDPDVAGALRRVNEVHRLVALHGDVVSDRASVLVVPVILADAIGNEHAGVGVRLALLVLAQHGGCGEVSSAGDVAHGERFLSLWWG